MRGFASAHLICGFGVLLAAVAALACHNFDKVEIANCPTGTFSRAGKWVPSDQKFRFSSGINKRPGKCYDSLKPLEWVDDVPDTCSEGQTAFFQQLQKSNVRSILLIGDSQMEYFSRYFSRATAMFRKSTNVSVWFDMYKVPQWSSNVRSNVVKAIRSRNPTPSSRMLVFFNFDLHYHAAHGVGDGSRATYNSLLSAEKFLSDLCDYFGVFNELRAKYNGTIDFVTRTTLSQHFPTPSGVGSYEEWFPIHSKFPTQCVDQVLPGLKSQEEWTQEHAHRMCIPHIDATKFYYNRGDAHVGSGKELDCTHYCQNEHFYKPLMSSLCEVLRWYTGHQTYQ